MKDSPQPHDPFELGLLNVNSDLNSIKLELSISTLSLRCASMALLSAKSTSKGIELAAYEMSVHNCAKPYNNV